MAAKLSRLRDKAASDGLRPAAGEWPALAALSALAVKSLQIDHARQVQRISLLDKQIDNAVRVRTEANTVLDDAVAVAYRSKALQQHPDKRRSGGAHDTFAFQRLRSAYETLSDATLRRRYIEALDHDVYLAERAAELQAESAADAQRARSEGGRGHRKEGGRGAVMLAIGAGLPVRARACARKRWPHAPHRTACPAPPSI